jgi:hypothetical protein
MGGGADLDIPSALHTQQALKLHVASEMQCVLLVVVKTSFRTFIFPITRPAAETGETSASAMQVQSRCEIAPPPFA